jgi:hypothetical protein
VSIPFPWPAALESCRPGHDRGRHAARRPVRPLPDELWEEAARHYDESQLAGLVLAIAAINAWNRINATTRQITGEWVGQWVSQAGAVSPAEETPASR